TLVSLCVSLLVVSAAGLFTSTLVMGAAGAGGAWGVAGAVGVAGAGAPVRCAEILLWEAVPLGTNVVSPDQFASCRVTPAADGSELAPLRGEIGALTAAPI